MQSTELSSLQAELNSLKSQIEIAKVDLESKEQLFKDGISSNKELIEAKLEEYTEPNRSMAVVGPLSAEERLRYSTAFLVRGPADYFLVKIAGVPKLLLIVTLDKSSPVIVVKI